MSDLPKKIYTPEQKKELAELRIECDSLGSRIADLEEMIVVSRSRGYATRYMVILKNQIKVDMDELGLRLTKFEVETVKIS